LRCPGYRVEAEAVQGHRPLGNNPPNHKVDSARQAIDAVGDELLYLPPYGPDLNRIEMLFAKLKAFLQKAAARFFEALFYDCVAALTRFQFAEFTNYFTAAGYLC